MRRLIGPLFIGPLVALLVALALFATTNTTAFAHDDDDDEVELAAELTGAAEVPGPGDPDGEGEAEIEIDVRTGRICFELEVEDIAPATAAHIHRGPRGVAGPLVVNLTPPTDGESEGCVAADPALAREIATNPSQFYVNVHNADFPKGALRGQLARDD